MTVRDLGYRPYDGPRNPPSTSVWVMLRYGLGRAWASWLVRLAALTSWLPVIALAVASIAANNVAPMLRTDIPPEFPLAWMADLVRDMADERKSVGMLFALEVWFFTTLVTAGAGASAIADDLTHRAFQFYFAKPMTAAHYLAGRVGAIALWVFAVVLAPASLYLVVMALFGPDTERLDTLALLLPVTLFALVLGVVLGSVAVAVSSLSKSRALTMSLWLTLFIVPHVIALIVDGVARLAGRADGFPWFYLGSFTSLLDVVRRALFNVDAESPLRWFHAAPTLAIMVGLVLWLAHHRIVRQDVIT